MTRYSGLSKIAQTAPVIPTFDDMVTRVVSGKNPGYARGLAGAFAPAAFYAVPGLRTAVPAANAMANTANAFGKGLSLKQRLGYLGSAGMDGLFAGLGAVADVGTVLTGGLGAIPASAITGGLGALRTGLAGAKGLRTATKGIRAAAQTTNRFKTLKHLRGGYLGGNAAWQTALKARTASPVGRAGMKPWASGLTMGERGTATLNALRYIPRQVGGQIAASPWTHGIVGMGAAGAMTADPGEGQEQGFGAQAQGQGLAPFMAGTYFQPQQAPTRFRGLAYMNGVTPPEQLPFSGTPTPDWLR